jgi:hypothetical protein
MDRNWLHVIPPEGAARQAALDLSEAAMQSEPTGSHKRFDTKPYLDGFAQLLKNPTDDMRVDLMNQALIIAALEHQCAVMCITSLAPVTLFSLRLLRQQGITLIHWMVEDYRVATYWRQVISAYHAVFAIQTGELSSRCQELGIPYFYLPTAYSPVVCSIPILPLTQRTVDFVFIGLPSPYRLLVLDALRLAGAQLQVGGTGWEHVSGPLRQCVLEGDVQKPQHSLLAQSKARFGLHIPYDDPKTERSQCHLSPRHFDMLALGCPLVCETSPLVQSWLKGYDCFWFEGAEQVVAAWLAAKKSLPQTETFGPRFDATMRDTRVRESYSQRWRQLKSSVNGVQQGSKEQRLSNSKPSMI